MSDPFPNPNSSETQRSLFQGLRLFVLPDKLAEEHIQSVKEKWSSEGGIMEPCMSDQVDYLLSQLPRQKILSKISVGTGVDWIDIRWINDCIAKRALQPCAFLGPTSPKPISSKRLTPMTSPASSPIRSVKPSSTLLSEKDSGNNQLLIDQLSKLMQHYKSTGKDHWRLNAYRKAIQVIKTYPQKITSGKEALQLPNIGKSIADKIDEILSTGRLRKTEMVVNEKDHVIALFRGIHGVGEKIALAWYEKGWRTLEDVREHTDQLTHDQKIGLQFYSEINDKIPYEEMIAFKDMMQKIALNVHPQFEVHLVGSFRRQETTFGDVDFVVTHPDPKLASGSSIPRFLQLMHAQDIQTVNLTHEPSDHALYIGLCKLNLPGSRFRRMDILMVPNHELGAALIHFTGNDLFNRRIRSFARTKGMKLNQHGLFKDEDGKEGDRVAGVTEEEVFEALGLPWVEPHQRLL